MAERQIKGLGDRAAIANGAICLRWGLVLSSVCAPDQSQAAIRTRGGRDPGRRWPSRGTRRRRPRFRLVPPLALPDCRQPMNSGECRCRAQTHLAATQTAVEAIPEDDAPEAVLVIAKGAPQPPQIQHSSPLAGFHFNPGRRTDDTSPYERIGFPSGPYQPPVSRRVADLSEWRRRESCIRIACCRAIWSGSWRSTRIRSMAVTGESEVDAGLVGSLNSAAQPGARSPFDRMNHRAAMLPADTLTEPPRAPMRLYEGQVRCGGFAFRASRTISPVCGTRGQPTNWQRVQHEPPRLQES